MEAVMTYSSSAGSGRSVVHRSLTTTEMRAM